MQDTVKYLRWNIFAKIVNSGHPLNIFAKSSILDVCLGSEYASWPDKFYAMLTCIGIFVHAKGILSLVLNLLSFFRSLFKQLISFF